MKNFLRDNKQVIYSIILIIVIPSVLIFNTYLFSNYFEEIADLSLQNKAIGIGQSFNTGVIDKLDSIEELQVFINNWISFNDDTKSLDILIPEDNSFRKVASMNNKGIGEIEKSYIYSLSWNADNPVAQKITEDDSVFWVIVMPLKDINNENKSLLSMKLSADFINTKLTTIITKSYLILIFSVILIILLLLVNSKLFEYSILYNKIKEIDKMKDDFISMASHELRTPVTVIRGYVQMMLEEDEALNKENKEYLSIIDTSTQRLANLIEDLLNVSRIEQGRLKIETKKLSVHSIIEKIIDEMSIQAKQKNLNLFLEKNNEVKDLIEIDEDRFRQVLINLIGNAIKYTNSGSVEVKTFNKNDNLIITIKDTGIGMNTKERERLFEKFYRVKNKKTEDVVGTGLGLWITKQIVELMKGSISVDSIEDVGTQITLEFPLI